MRVGSRAVAMLLALTTFAAYLLTLAPDVQAGDSGEFQFAAPLLSIVHPTGYPLYLIIAKLFTLIPVGSVAYRINLLSAVCAALAVAGFYLVALESSEPRTSAVVRHSAAAIAALTLAFSATFWAQATNAEVYALNALFVVALLALAVRIKRTERNARWWPWLALAFGLALAHHRSIVLLLPALMIYLHPFAGARAQLPRLVAFALAPLLLYLYTPLRYDATPYTRIALDAQHVIVTLEQTPAGFAAHALGIGFGTGLRWDAQSLARLVATPETTMHEFTIVGVALGLAGVASIVRRRAWRLLGCIAAVLISFIGFNALYHIGDIGDFYTPAYIVYALLIAEGIQLLASVHAAAPLTAIVVPIALLITNWAPVGQHEDVRGRWNARLGAGVPGGAVLISNDRDEITPLYYLQLVEQVRPDTVGLFPLISNEAPTRNVAALTQYALETPRPVYFVKPMDSLSVKFRLERAGPLVRVLGIQDFTPQHVLVRESGMLNMTGWTVSDEARRAPDDGSAGSLGVVLYWQAAADARPDLKTYVHLVKGGNTIVAQDDHVPGAVYYPPSQWATGEWLRDEHRLTFARDLAGGEYQLIAGAYFPDGRGLEGVAAIELGVVVLR